MKYIVKLNVDTIALIALYNKAKVAKNEALVHRDLVANTIKLPSGRTRNGGKQDLADAQEKFETAYKEYMSCYNMATAHIRNDVMVTRRQHIIDTLDMAIHHAPNNVTEHVRVAARNCFVERAIQTITCKGYSFDVNCDIEYDGLSVNVWPKGEGRSIGGGVVNVRRKHNYAYNRELEKKMDETTSVAIVGDELHVELPDDYRDGGYTISFQSRSDLDVDYARAAFFIFDACVDIANYFNCYVVESAIAHATYKAIS